jgi:GNAT superfamily N-acetyltransferase
MDEYVVKEINGYYISFSGNSEERAKSTAFHGNVSIVARNPTIEEFIALHHSVGWTSSIKMEHIHTQLSAPVHSVVAIDITTNEMIGCALVISDNASFYYIKDVMVKKEWQGKRVGTALMKALCDWLDKNGISKSFVGLYTRENLEPFYAQFGFGKAFGMMKTL